MSTTRTLQIPTEVSNEKILAFARCYQFETWLREMVYLEMKAYYGSAYWAECESAMNRNGGIGIPATKSRHRDHQHPHMATPENDPVWFISFDSLLRIILDAQLWPHFEPFLTTKNLLEAKLEEIKLVRNRVAHARALHADDVDRLRRFLRDVDQGFWLFCTSYNTVHPFIGGVRTTDDVFKHFQSLQGIDWVESEPNQWTQVGMTRGLRVNVTNEYVIRPSTVPAVAIVTGKGRLHRFVFSTWHTQGHLDYEAILKHTVPYHETVAHIMIDSSQQTLKVTIPAIEGTKAVIEAGEAFLQACERCTTFSYAEMIDKRYAEQNGGAKLDLREMVVRHNEPFDVLAANWPPYVVPPAIHSRSCTPTALVLSLPREAAFLSAFPG